MIVRVPPVHVASVHELPRLVTAAFDECLLVELTVIRGDRLNRTVYVRADEGNKIRTHTFTVASDLPVYQLLEYVTPDGYDRNLDVAESGVNKVHAWLTPGR